MFFRNPNARFTAIHRLHPFTKMGAGIGFSALALCLHSPWALTVLFGFMLAVLCIARLRLTLRQWFMILLFFSVISTLNFMASGDPMHAVTYSLRFAVFLTAMPILASTTAPQEMTRALSRTPLPSGVVMALLLVWRFFPLMTEEAGQMRQASLLRGNASGSFVTRLYRGIIVPLAFCMIEYSDRITLALELRGFSPAEGRTCHNPVRAGLMDGCFSMFALVAACTAAWLQWGA